ncbi:MAG: amidase [Rhizomicrobium sp.]
MKLVEYARYDALGLAELVRAKQVSPSELRAAATEASARLNGELNFLVGEPVALPSPAPTEDVPFAGVPTLIKDIGAAVAGLPQEMGCALAQGLTPDRDSELTRRLRAAGLVIIGRSATPELGGTFTTEPKTTGATKNPWDLTRSVGGSSGGAAAAVASGAVPVAHAGDSAGSIRVPAHCCGVFGLKPTRGRNPTGPQAGEVNAGLTVAHVLTRTVRDSAAVLDATAGPDAGCRYAAPPSGGTFLSAARRAPARLRIAVSLGSPLADRVSSDVRDAARATATLCARLGHHVEEAAPSFDPETFVETLETIWCANIHHSVRKLEAATGRKADRDTLEASTLAMTRLGAEISSNAYLGALDRMNAISRQIGTFFETYDVLVTPTLSQAAPKLGVIDADAPVTDMARYLRDLLGLAAFTAQYNMTGQPAMTMPLHQNAAGLPIGTQMVGRYAAEEALFSLAGQLEQALPWRDRHPAIGIF